MRTLSRNAWAWGVGLGALWQVVLAAGAADMGGGMFPMVPPGPAMAAYRDPQGRFQMQHPQGWAAQAFPNGQGVAFMQGQTAVSVLLVGAAEPQRLVEGIVANMQRQWQGFQATRRGQRQVGAQAAAPVAEFAGTNPQGMAAQGQVTASAAGNAGVVFILTVPQGQLAAAEASWDALLRSFAPAGAAPAIAKGPTAGPAGWREYRHASGAAFRYPPTWRVQEQDGMPQLIPPDAAVVDGAPVELYFAFGEDVSAQGVQQANDARLLQYLDTQIQSLSAALRRVGAGAAAQSGLGPGVALDWQAAGAGGQVVSARAYVVVAQDKVLAIVGMGLRERIQARDAVLRQIFATLGFGQPGGAQPVAPAPGGTAAAAVRGKGGDPRLVGTWVFEKHLGVAGHGTSTVNAFRFHADGTFAARGHKQAEIATGARTSDTTDLAGGWTAANGVLSLVFADGDRDQVRYYIEDPSQPGSTAATMGKRLMLVTTADGERQLWTHQP